MMRTRSLLAVFCLVCAAQIALPAYTILRHEQTISRGEVYRFRCEPVDPVDLFRGRYVALSFTGRDLVGTADPPFTRGESIYVRVDHGPDGFAELSSPARERPTTGDYIEVKSFRQYNGRVRIELPFSRYYIEESLAQDAEEAYRREVARDDVEVYAAVSVLDGRGVFEDLYLGQVPFKEYLKESREP